MVSMQPHGGHAATWWACSRMVSMQPHNGSHGSMRGQIAAAGAVSLARWWLGVQLVAHGSCVAALMATLQLSRHNTRCTAVAWQRASSGGGLYGSVRHQMAVAWQRACPVDSVAIQIATRGRMASATQGCIATAFG